MPTIPVLLDGLALLEQNQSDLGLFILLTLDNVANRMTLCQRYILQMADLSALDGRIEAYRGYDG